MDHGFAVSLGNPPGEWQEPLDSELLGNIIGGVVGIIGFGLGIGLVSGDFRRDGRVLIAAVGGVVAGELTAFALKKTRLHPLIILFVRSLVVGIVFQLLNGVRVSALSQEVDGPTW